MLKELTKTDWLKILNISEHEIPTTLILRGTRNLTNKYEDHKLFFNNVRELVFPNGIFENIFIGELNGNITAFATVYGASMASEVVHLFGVLGTSLVIHTGCCGGLDSNLKTGDIFIAEEAYVGEGASQYYNIDDLIIKPSINNLLKFNGIKVGRIFTTSALLAEGKEDIEKWFNLGCLTVDMETSAVFSTANYFRMESTSVLFVFDNPSNKDHLFVEDKNKTALYNNGQKEILEIAREISANHNIQLKSKVFL